jgi:hypothetical protein
MEIADDHDNREYDEVALERAEAVLSGAPKLPSESYQDLYVAARGVIDRWESGDLAEAVRELAAAVSEIDDSLERAPPDEDFEEQAVERCDRCQAVFDASNPGTEIGRCVCGAIVLPRQASDSEIIPVIIRSDDEEADVVALNGAPWFASLTDRELSLTIGLRYQARDVLAYWFESRAEPVKDLLAYAQAATKVGCEVGFEVEIDEKAADAWVKANRPHLLK